MTIIAASGVVIASAALFIVLSGFAGLKDFSLGFSTFVDPDLKILPAQGKSFLLTENDSTSLSQIEGIANFSKVIEERVILEFNNKNLLCSLKGVDENYLNVTQMDSMIIEGSWFEPGTGQIVSGWGIAHNLSMGVLEFGRTPKIYVPKPGKGQISSVKGAFNIISVVNIGVFQINEDLDNTYLFTDLVNAKYLLNYGNNQISAIELKLKPNADEPKIIQAITDTFGDKVIVKNRAQLNDSLYKMLNTENLAVYLIFTLVIIISLFNVIGALIMMILDKKKSLHTLFNLGATAKDIKRIFFLQGSLMTVIGGVIGTLLGILIIFLQQKFSLVMLTASLPYPVTLDFMNAVDRIVGGLEKRNKIITVAEKKSIAIHEAGHATLSWMLEHANPLVKVTIIPRGKALGAAWYLPEERQITTKSQMLDEMCAILGGRAAEELFIGEISSGAMNDLERVTKQANAMVTYLGMSDKLPNLCYYDSAGQEWNFSKPYSEDTAKLIDSEVKMIIAEQYERAKEILNENSEGHRKLAEILLEKEIIYAVDLEVIFGKRPWVSRAQELLKDQPIETVSETSSESPSGGKKEIFIHEKEESEEKESSQESPSDDSEEDNLSTN